MNGWTIVAMMTCLCWIGSMAESRSQLEGSFGSQTNSHLDNDIHTRSKRTLLLKKKLLGAGLFGLGLGVAKGYKIGRYHAPEVHHVYVAPAPPAVKYVEYVEKPVYIEKYVEKPVFKPSPIEFDHHPWLPSEPSPVYGAW